MRIRVTRSGGIAGLTLKAELETSGLPDAADLERLALEVVAGGRPGPVSGVPDGYHYTVTVDDRTVEFADPDISDAQEDLVERVLRDGA
ncbi:protealysin inhibitor emfourin [Streptomyces sp. NPDC051183]|uniref:protealysin inhibitor emfourin n=1 Tax=unclassified Streptomyces TaxID=2593676 RepID=UPI003427A330